MDGHKVCFQSEDKCKVYFFLGKYLILYKYCGIIDPMRNSCVRFPNWTELLTQQKQHSETTRMTNPTSPFPEIAVWLWPHFHCWKCSVTSVEWHSRGGGGGWGGIQPVCCGSHTSVCGQVETPDTKHSDNNKKEKKQEKGQGGLKEVVGKNSSWFKFFCMNLT